jgi:hypothetical protein
MDSIEEVKSETKCLEVKAEIDSLEVKVVRPKVSRSIKVVEKKVMRPADLLASCNYMARTLYGLTIKEALGTKHKLLKSAYANKFKFEISNAFDSSDKHYTHLISMLNHATRAGISVDIKYIKIM